MLSKERQQIKDVLDLIAEGGRFRQFDKVGSAVEPQRIANKLNKYGALIPQNEGVYGKQWYLTDSGKALHDMLKSGDIENPDLWQDNYILSQWALLTSGSRRKGRKDAEIALLDIALGRSSASEDYAESAHNLLMNNGSPQSIESLRFLARLNFQLDGNAARLDDHDSDLLRYNTSLELQPQGRAIFERVRADMESNTEYGKGQLSNKDIVLIMAIVWLQLRGK